MSRRHYQKSAKASGGVVLPWIIGGIAAGALAACSTATLPALPKFEMPVVAYKDEPSEVYSRIARGAMACWFSPNGPLKPSYAFHADVAPPSDNAGAEIVIHERDRAAPSPLSLRAYKIVISRKPEGTAVEEQNFKLPEPLAAMMAQDIRRWAGGTHECGTAMSVAQPAADAQKAATPVSPIPTSSTGGKKR
ncbi:MAG: hypothetical protein ACKVP3_22465 [Hyphomicrobiaceae bacterium]